MFRDKLLERARSLKSPIILWPDLSDLGSSRQISRALNDLIDDGELIRVGRGVYAKAEMPEYLNRPILQEGFDMTCVEVLKRLGVQWEASQAIKDYNEGRSEQVPAVCVSGNETKIQPHREVKLGHNFSSM
jgi:hypothetical protein